MHLCNTDRHRLLHCSNNHATTTTALKSIDIGITRVSTKINHLNSGTL